MSDNVNLFSQKTNSGESYKHELLEIKRNMCIALNCDPEKPPVSFTREDAAIVLGVKPATMAHWASVGRYDLKFTKAGRLVRYPLDSLAAFIYRRTYCHTGEM